MTPTAGHDTAESERELAARRVEFLRAELDEQDRVRGTILTSWRRSRDLNVAADQIDAAVHRPRHRHPAHQERGPRAAQPA